MEREFSPKGLTVKSIDVIEVKKVLKTCPKIIQDYVTSLEHLYEGQKQLTQKAIANLRNLNNNQP